jgi:uncharacterized membrane protein YoaK (UPF0700 family)
VAVLRRDAALLALTFSSGAADAIAFLGLDKVFSAFMTGNLVFLGLASAGARQPELDRVLTALGAFAVGVFVGVRIVKPTRGTGLWPTRVSVALAVTAVAEACFLAGWVLTSGRPAQASGNLLIAISALALGVQSAAVMSLDVKGIFTTAATASLIMLVSNEAGRSSSTGERRRLFGVLVALVAGATAAGALVLRAQLYAPTLPLAGTVAAIGVATAATDRRAVAPAREPLPSRR